MSQIERIEREIASERSIVENCNAIIEHAEDMRDGALGAIESLGEQLQDAWGDTRKSD